MTKIAMLQPNYIPWKGVFDLINRVDIFVFYDDVQYTSKDWRNRNKIKTSNGEIWLSVPVKQNRHQLIYEAQIDTTTDWQTKHFKSIKLSYQKAPHYKDYEYLIEEIYLKTKWKYISELNIFSTKIIAEALGIQTIWKVARELNMSGNKEGEKIIKICNALKANHFINGPSAKTFINEELFTMNHIQLEYIEYAYQEYPQLHGRFSHNVSILDLIFNCGANAKKFIEPLKKSG